MQFPITIGLRRSFLLDCVVLFVAMAVTAFVCFFPRPVWLIAGLVLSVWLLTALAWRRLRPPFVALRLLSDGRLEGQLPRTTDFLPLCCLPGATVHPLLTVLRLKPESGGPIRVLVVVGDSTGADDFRRLRVFLRWRTTPFSVADDVV